MTPPPVPFGWDGIAIGWGLVFLIIIGFVIYEWWKTR